MCSLVMAWRVAAGRHIVGVGGTLGSQLLSLGKFLINRSLCFRLVRSVGVRRLSGEGVDPLLAPSFSPCRSALPPPPTAA